MMILSRFTVLTPPTVLRFRGNLCKHNRTEVKRSEAGLAGVNVP